MWIELQSLLQSVVEDNPTSITIRRNAADLAAQTVRIARTGGGGAFKIGQDGATQESRGRVVVVGGVDFDVQPEDRFTVDGVLYRVILVRPNRRAATVAEAEVVQ